MTKTKTFASGSPLTYALKGIDKLDGSAKTNATNYADPIADTYGTNLSTDTAAVLKQLNNAIDGVALINAIHTAGLHEVTDYTQVLPDYTVANLDTDNPDLSDVMNIADNKITDGLCSREAGAAEATTRANRESVYIPELVSEEGTVYMAKTLSSTAKLRMAWDIDSENEVVLVDDYELWENLFGWEKLKQFPHGKNKIREEYADVLSDEVLTSIIGQNSGDTETKADDESSGSRGRRTRTKPSEEVLNVGVSRKHKERDKIRSKNIADTFDNGDSLSLGHSSAEMLILFPTTSDLLLSEHWWVAGTKGDGESVALANCNKGTFEYLNQYESVWHIEDYLNQAEDYEFETSVGPVTMNTVAQDNLVAHIMTEDDRKLYTRENIFPHMTQAIHEYAEDNMYKSQRLPHTEDMIYAAITREDAFWLRPELRKQQNPEDGDALVAKAGVNTGDLGKTTNISSGFSLFARARLHKWDFDAVEMQVLEDVPSYKLNTDNGGFDLLETLGKLHDRGEKPFSQTPQSRWSQ